MAVIIPIIALGAIGGFCYYQNNGIQKSRFQIHKGLKSSIKIVQLSDLHSKIFRGNNKGFINMIKEEKPDLVFATGDMIDSSLKNKEKIIEFLGSLTKYSKVVYIPGNNENRCIEVNSIIEDLKKKGVIALRNEFYSENIKGEQINILGLSEILQKSDKLPKVNDTYEFKGVDKFFEQLNDMKGLKVVLSHYPENFYGINGRKGYIEYNFDVMFSGHAHGGQFILPFIGGLFAPGQGILPKYYKGMHGTEEKKLIVSRGLGNSGFPLRLFNRPDLVVVEID